MAKFALLVFVFCVGSFQLNAQCLLQSGDAEGAVVQAAERNIFYFYTGTNEQDKLNQIYTFNYPHYKIGDTIIWKFNKDKICFVSYQKSSRKKKIFVYTGIFVLTDNHIILTNNKFYSTKYKINSEYNFKYFNGNKVLLQSAKSGKEMAINLSDKASVTDTIPYQQHNSIVCNYSEIPNPNGPQARRKRNEKAAFSQDSLLSYPLAVIKKALIAQQSNMVWQNNLFKLDKWNDSLFADYSTDNRELHQLELYMEEKDFNDIPIHGSIQNIYPGLFAGKNVQLVPHYKKNNIRGWRFMWYTYPMLNFKFLPNISAKIPVLMVSRSTDNLNLATNALYPESLFLNDSVFQDIYSSPKPEERAKSILGWNCIANEQNCNATYIQYAQIEDLRNRGYTLDTIINLANTKDSIIKTIHCHGENIALVSINSCAPKIALRMDNTYPWINIQLGARYKYSNNITYITSSAFKHKINSYQLKLIPNIQCALQYYLVFSAASE
jgi:hypothetical protein